MAVKLTVVLFSHNSGRSIVSFLPSVENLTSLAGEQKEISLSFIIVEEKLPPYESENVTVIRKTKDAWILKNNIDELEGEVMFLSLNSEVTDTYSIMEDLETQRYDARYYFSVATTDGEKIDIKKYLGKWKRRTSALDEDSSSGGSKGKKKAITKYYKVYSGAKLNEDLAEIETKAIYWRMWLLCENITKYLELGFARKYNIEEMQALPSVEQGYTKAPFYSEEDIQQIAINSRYFQAEDPILKGFILAHPIKVVSFVKRREESPSPGKGAPPPELDNINPLDIDRTVQWLIFNHGQFREELLHSLMKVVTNFAINNGLIKKKHLPRPEVEVVAIKVKPSKSRTPTAPPRARLIEEVQPHKVVEVQEEEEVAPTKKEIVPKGYYQIPFWDRIMTELQARITPKE